MFQDMKIPDSMLQFLKSKKITTPTPIQLQGIPTAYVSSSRRTTRCAYAVQLCRPRYDWDCVYRFRKDPCFLSSPHHARSRRRSPPSPCPWRRSRGCCSLSLTRACYANVRERALMDGCHIQGSQIPSSEHALVHRWHIHGGTEPRIKQGTSHCRCHPWQTDRHVGEEEVRVCELQVSMYGRGGSHDRLGVRG